MEVQYIDIQNVWDYVISLGEDGYFYKPIPVTPPFENIVFNWKSETGNRVKCVCELIEFDSDNTKTIVFTFSFAGVVFGESLIDLKPDGIAELFETDEQKQKRRMRANVFNVYIPGLDNKDFPNYVGSFSIFVLFTLSLMHVKNIELIDQPLTRQQRRRKERKNEPFYKVLAIEPFKTQVRNEARRTGQTDLQVALHICRGNFATYTEDKPLFGKFVGTYFRPAHMRGNAKHGEVIKDYKINPQSNA